MIELEEIIDAYMDCRKHKRNTFNALRFEADYERNCIILCDQINNRTYKPGKSIAFVVEKPVCREVFAADFRDRVVHHLIAREIVPFLREQFLLDSYSTQKDKGTLFGIHRIEGQLKECSCNYTKGGWVMKLDIKSFFMSLPKDGLYECVVKFLKERYKGKNLETLLWLLKVIIYNRPELNCVRKSPKILWDRLPKTKSLFHTDGMHGLPIGNYTSQLLALLYLDPLDHLITEEWHVRGYGRYVDDMVLMDESCEHLLGVREKIRKWLKDRNLTLHPKKFYFQPWYHGVNFIGGSIRTKGCYVSRRTVGYIFSKIHNVNDILDKGEVKNRQDIDKVLSSMNSYFGMMRHYLSYHLFERTRKRLSHSFFKYFYIVSKRTPCGLICKVVPRKSKTAVD